MRILSALTDASLADSVNAFAGRSFSELKARLTDVAVAHLEPISDRLRELTDDAAELDRLLARGNRRARELGGQHIREIQTLVGLLNPAEH